MDDCCTDIGDMGNDVLKYIRMEVHMMEARCPQRFPLRVGLPAQIPVLLLNTVPFTFGMMDEIAGVVFPHVTRKPSCQRFFITQDQYVCQSYVVVFSPNHAFKF